MTATKLLFASSFSSCLSVFLIVLCLGIAGSGLLEWGKARQDQSLTLKAIHYSEAGTRMLFGGCLAASLVILVVANSTSDIPTANTIMNAFIIPGFVCGAVSYVCTVAKYVLLVRAQVRLGRLRNG